VKLKLVVNLDRIVKSLSSACYLMTRVVESCLRWAEPVICTVRPKVPPRTDSRRSSSRTVPQYFGEVKYGQGFKDVSYTAPYRDPYPN
jgi:hypothetical protein